MSRHSSSRSVTRSRARARGPVTRRRVRLIVAPVSLLALGAVVLSQAGGMGAGPSDSVGQAAAIAAGHHAGRQDSPFRIRGHRRHRPGTRPTPTGDPSAPPPATPGTAGAPNPNCTLLLPADPLSAEGLATPFRLAATDPAAGACHEANADQSAFVQGAIIARDGTISLYDPLVIDDGTTPAAPPVAADVPAGSTVALWFGFNGDTLRLDSAPGSDGVRAGRCVTGTAGSPFGQFSYCNAPAFFRIANAAIAVRRLRVPALGTTTDGKPCPTVRDFSVVDQDQSDNVTTHYWADAKGNTAQQGANLPGAIDLINGSDNLLLTRFIDPALGCSPWTVRDQSNGGQPGTALPLDELQAAAYQAAPVALVPLNDPMTLVNGAQDPVKTSLYRAGVDQPQIGASTGGTGTGGGKGRGHGIGHGDGGGHHRRHGGNASPPNAEATPLAPGPAAGTTTPPAAATAAGTVPPVADPTNGISGDGTAYCRALFLAPQGIQRVFAAQASFATGPSPDPATGSNLFTFLAARASGSFGDLGCGTLLGQANPIALTTDAAGVATAATIGAGTPALTTATTSTSSATGTPTATATTPPVANDQAATRPTSASTTTAAPVTASVTVPTTVPPARTSVAADSSMATGSTSSGAAPASGASRP